MVSQIEINGRSVGPGAPIYIVAEMSANHHRDFEQAVEIVRAAKKVGADAVKLQTYTPETLTISSDEEYFSIGQGTIWSGRKLYDLYRDAYMPWEWQPKLKGIANEIGLDLFSTAFDQTAVDFLEEMNVPAYKIASFELVDLSLIQRVARTGKPIMMSTGMATFEEIDEAVKTAQNERAKQIILLKCTSAYPAPPDEMNLRTIPHLTETFGLPVGLSDHTLGIAVPIAAVAVGACVVEKHFTLSRSIPGPDSAFSLEPHEFKMMVEAIRTSQKALGEVSYGVGEKESKSRAFRRSLFVLRDIKAGEIFTQENIRSIRPGYGLAPKYLGQILGRRAAKDIKRGTPLTWELIS